MQKALFRKVPLFRNKVDLLSTSHSQAKSGLLTSSSAILTECSNFRGRVAWGLERLGGLGSLPGRGVI